MNFQFQIRRGTAIQWATANPILAEGEMGLDIDTNRIKIGNGVGHWLELSYATLHTIAKLTDIGDVDTSNVTSGSTLVFDGPSETWKTTTTLNAQQLDGGTF